MKRNRAVIVSICLSSLALAAGHFPMLSMMTDAPNAWILHERNIWKLFARHNIWIIFWRYGLVASMISHFVADLVVHLF